MERDRFFSAEQALEYGLIDRVLDSPLSDLRPRAPRRLGARGRGPAGSWPGLCSPRWPA